MGTTSSAEPKQKEEVTIVNEVLSPGNKQDIDLADDQEQAKEYLRLAVICLVASTIAVGGIRFLVWLRKRNKKKKLRRQTQMMMMSQMRPMPQMGMNPMGMNPMPQMHSMLQLQQGMQPLALPAPGDEAKRAWNSMLGQNV